MRARSSPRGLAVSVSEDLVTQAVHRFLVGDPEPGGALAGRDECAGLFASLRAISVQERPAGVEQTGGWRSEPHSRAEP